jgi:hypothetical protein
MLKAVQIFLGQALNLGQQGTYDIIFYGSDGQKEQPMPQPTSRVGPAESIGGP